MVEIQFMFFIDCWWPNDLDSVSRSLTTIEPFYKSVLHRPAWLNELDIDLLTSLNVIHTHSDRKLFDGFAMAARIA
jgi:hypothetical protein